MFEASLQNSPQCSVTGVRAHGEAGQHHAFEQPVRIEAQDIAVLTGARLGFIGVDDEGGGAFPWA